MDQRIKRRDKRRIGRSPVAAFLDKQGMYLVMFVCLAVIGIAAYFTLGDTEQPQARVTPSPPQQQVGQIITPPPATPTVTPKPTPVPTPTPSPTEKPVAAPAQKAILPLQGTVIREFSTTAPVYFETLNAWMIHNAVDLAAAEGSGVKAALDGTVKSVKNDPETGYTIVLSHAGKIETVYGNLAAPEGVEVGQLFAQGDVIGAVGRSAQNVIDDPPHLHFAYIINGKFHDPLKYCK
jgi:murein DD-endopeptidase MepM/ murein hydrolase activator NlpD